LLTQALIASPLQGGPERHDCAQLSGAKRSVFAFAATMVGACSLALPARAHGFGQRYDLPLPLSLYLFGTAAAVVLSFVIVGLFARRTPGARGYPHIDLLAHLLGRRIAWAIAGFLNSFSIGVFGFIV